MTPTPENKKRIYSSWAFSENEREKSKINYEIYKELIQKYKVYRGDVRENLNFDNYDVIINRTACYLHGEYKVYKNTPNLSDDELALLCDEGNLCFGYSKMGSKGFYVFEDWKIRQYELFI